MSAEITRRPAAVLTDEEWDAEVARATELDEQIREGLAAGVMAFWATAKPVHEFVHMSGASRLGYSDFNEYMGDLGVSRSTFYRMHDAWEYLAIRLEMDFDDIVAISPYKFQVVLPSLKRHQTAKGKAVVAKKAIDDVAVLSTSDLIEKYRKPEENPRKSVSRRRDARTEDEADETGDGVPGKDVDDDEYIQSRVEQLSSNGDGEEAEAGDEVLTHAEAWEDLCSARDSGQSHPRVDCRALVGVIDWRENLIELASEVRKMPRSDKRKSALVAAILD